MGASEKILRGAEGFVLTHRLLRLLLILAMVVEMFCYYNYSIIIYYKYMITIV